jgi:hypothetical protein
LVDDRENFAVRLVGVDAMASARVGDLVLSFTGGDLIGGRPVVDTSLVTNVATVTGVDGPGGGGSATVEVTGGLMGTVLAGERAVQVTVSADSPDLLADHAAWFTQTGTCSEPSWQGLMVHTSRTPTAAVLGAVLGVDIGSGLTVSDPPTWSGVDDLGQVTVGVVESIDQVEHVLEWAVQPASMVALARWDDSVSRWAPDVSCALTGDVTTTGITLTVSVGTGWAWTHADGDYDIIVDGERMTVTAVGAAGATQTLTVTRSVNGIVKAHTTGALVDLWQGRRWMIGKAS